MKATIIYWSATGNTKKVAVTIHDALKNRGIDAEIKTVKESANTDLHDYDLLFIGAPSYMWSPPDPVRQWINDRMGYYHNKKVIKPGAPIIPGKKAVVFVTYSGPHTGIDEAIPAGEYMGQFLAHIGFDVLDKWYIVGEFHNSVENSTLGRLGDIRGRPNEEDLDAVVKDVEKVLGNING
jgi:multimeric flavodoxin WrbA